MDRRGFLGLTASIFFNVTTGCLERESEVKFVEPNRIPTEDPIVTFTYVVKNGPISHSPSYERDIKSSAQQNRIIQSEGTSGTLAAILDIYRHIQSIRNELIKKNTLKVPDWDVLETKIEREEVDYWNSHTGEEIPGEEVLALVDETHFHAKELHDIFEEIFNKLGGEKEYLYLDEILINTERFSEQPKDEVLEIFKKEAIHHHDEMMNAREKIVEFKKIESAVNEITLTDRLRSLI